MSLESFFWLLLCQVNTIPRLAWAAGTGRFALLHGHARLTVFSVVRYS
jgi:hypothetical protein